VEAVPVTFLAAAHVAAHQTNTSGIVILAVLAMLAAVWLLRKLLRS
jgi:flagellar biogenesis protein FliO